MPLLLYDYTTGGGRCSLSHDCGRPRLDFLFSSFFLINFQPVCTAD